MFSLVHRDSLCSLIASVLRVITFTDRSTYNFGILRVSSLKPIYTAEEIINWEAGNHRCSDMRRMDGWGII